jgi:hypothetical protein
MFKLPLGGPVLSEYVDQGACQGADSAEYSLLPRASSASKTATSAIPPSRRPSLWAVGGFSGSTDGRARGAPEKAKTAAVHRWIEEASRAAGLLIGNNDNVR